MTEYAALLAKVDAFAAAAVAAQRQWLQCRRGCDGCCRVRPNAWPVEIEHIRQHLQTLPADRREALQARRLRPEVHAGARCVYLDDDGACAIYPARPMICRTHGPAVEADGLAWCDLNFEGMDADAVAAAVPADAVLDLDRLNTVLAVVNARFCGDPSGGRRAPIEEALGDAP